MDHQNDNEIDGLNEAILRLPAPFRSSARSEVIRSIMEDGYAEVFGPFSICYKDPSGTAKKQAKLLIFMGETFIFDLFYVPIEGRDHMPAVGRFYYLDSGSEFIYLN